MSVRSPLGQVVILKIPVLIDETLEGLYKKLINYNEEICIGFPKADYSNIIICVEEENQSMQRVIKAYFEDVIEVSLLPYKTGEFTIMGNKSLWPSPLI